MASGKEKEGCSESLQTSTSESKQTITVAPVNGSGRTITIQEICGITMEPIYSYPESERIFLSCKHGFHKPSLARWCFKENIKCPLCRGALTKQELDTLFTKREKKILRKKHLKAVDSDDSESEIQVRDRAERYAWENYSSDEDYDSPSVNPPNNTKKQHITSPYDDSDEDEEMIPTDELSSSSEIESIETTESNSDEEDRDIDCEWIKNDDDDDDDAKHQNDEDHHVTKIIKKQKKNIKETNRQQQQQQQQHHQVYDTNRDKKQRYSMRHLKIIEIPIRDNFCNAGPMYSVCKRTRRNRESPIDDSVTYYDIPPNDTTDHINCHQDMEDDVESRESKKIIASTKYNFDDFDYSASFENIHKIEDDSEDSSDVFDTDDMEITISSSDTEQ